MRVDAARVVEAVLEQKPPPCELGCKYVEYCVQNRACERYAYYMGSGKLRGRREDQLSQVPTRRMYNCLFPEIDTPLHGNSVEMRLALSGAL